jgi:hypothetical protein
MLEKHYDRTAQDIGNIVNIGHVNVCITISTYRRIITSPAWG